MSSSRRPQARGSGAKIAGIAVFVVVSAVAALVGFYLYDKGVSPSSSNQQTVQSVVNLLEQTERDVESGQISYNQLADRIKAMDAKYTECISSLSAEQRSKAYFGNLKVAIDDYRASLAPWMKQIDAKVRFRDGSGDEEKTLYEKQKQAAWAQAKYDSHLATIQLKQEQ